MDLPPQTFEVNRKVRQMKTLVLTAMLALTAAMVVPTVAMAGSPCRSCGNGFFGHGSNHGHCGCRFGECRKGARYPWHGQYAHTEWGTPVALVVPPTAELQANYGWGVGNTRVTKICPQFQRNYPGAGAAYGGVPIYSTPVWPSDTAQFGVYYVRAPFR